MEGLFPYGKLVKKLHFDAPKTELLFRGCTADEVNNMTITQRKNKLKQLEIDRLNDDEVGKELASAAFKPLSAAQFPAR